MKKVACVFIIAVLGSFLIFPVHAIGPKHGGPAAAAVPVASSPAGIAASAALSWPDSSDYADMSTQALWEEFAQAEANKKLCELKERGIREERKLLESPNAYFYYYSGDTDMGAAHTRLMELESQSYALKLQKEGYEWQKKQAEGYLKLLGAKPDRAQLEYGLYTGTLTVQDASYEELYTQRSSLQLQEQQAEWQKKSLEYQYQLEQLGDSEFVEQYSALVLEKETVKLQREQLDAQIQLLFGLAAPAPGLGILP